MSKRKISSEKEELSFNPNQDDKSSPYLKFGWGKFRPKCLQIVNGPICFLSVVVVFTACQATVIMGLTSITLPSIEKRFSLTSKELGVILASNDISALIVVIFIGYYGDYWNKIRLIGGGGVILSFSVLLYAVPHFIIGPYEPSLTGSRGPTCFSGNITESEAKCTQESDSRWYYMAMFVLGQLMMGAGVSPFYSLLPAYLDENVHPKHMPVYLGVWTFANFLGPGIGMIVGGKFLSIYVDLKQPDGVNLTTRDPRWIGAWWLGFVVFGIIIFTFSIILLGFPREFPGAKEMREEHIKKGNIRKAQKTETPTLKTLLPDLKDILTNWTFLFTSLGLSSTLFYVGAHGPFYPKILLMKFGVTSEKIGYVLGAMFTPAMGVGIIIGSLVLKTFPLKEVCKKAALYIFIVRILLIISPLSFLIAGCDDINLAGVTTSYNDTMTNHTIKPILPSTNTLSLTSTCNKNCQCTQSRYAPVCGSDHVTYFDMCHAGCKVQFPNKTFTNCSCIASSSSDSQFGTARMGMCDRNCKNFIVFIMLVALSIVLEFAMRVPEKTVTLRCVPDNKRAFANGIQYIFMKTLGFFPGPILFGHIVDSYCTLWQDTCGVKGRCFDYDVDKLSNAICVLGIILTFVSLAFYFLAWYFYKPEKVAECEVIINAPDVLQNGNETKV